MTPHGRAIRTLIERLEARIEGTEETPAHNVAALLTRLERQTAALQKLRASKNPLDTDAAHSRKIATAAQKMRAEASRIQATIKTVVTSGLAELSNAVDKKAGLIPGEHAAEIRAALRGMDAKSRADAVQQALVDGDAPTIAAACLVPPLLSGVTERQQQNCLKQLRESRAGDLIRQMDDLNEALATASAVEQSTQGLYDDSYSPAEQHLIDAAEQQAAEAEAALSESLGNPTAV